MLTWDAEHVEDEAGQHEGQDGPVVAEAAVAELLAAVPDGRHLHQPQGDLLHQGHQLRLLVAQLHLNQRTHWLGHWFPKCGTCAPRGNAAVTKKDPLTLTTRLRWPHTHTCSWLTLLPEVTRSLLG